MSVVYIFIRSKERKVGKGPFLAHLARFNQNLGICQRINSVLVQATGYIHNYLHISYQKLMKQSF